MRVIVPWAYHMSQRCKIKTEGAPGTKYTYFFSDDHSIVDLQRQNVPLPKGNPFGSDTVQIADFPMDADWLAPPFQQFFRPFDFPQRFGKPLIFISNKYRREYKQQPYNFMSINVLRKLLTYLTPKYHVVYKRHTAEVLKDFEDKERDLGDKTMIRKEFPGVVLFEQLRGSLHDDPEDENLLMFTLMAASNGFVCVQGGMSVASSYFGGSNVILIKKGSELKSGSYGYFHRFSGANVTWKLTDGEFLDTVYTTF
jgi:hypothetical protein